MGKKVELDLNCPQCQAAFKATLYRTIWVEFPEYMDLVQKDQINVVHCPACGFSEMPPFPFLATNVKKKIAIWYEPIPDKNIDSDIELYRRHYAGDFYLANAPRIKNWEEFKRCLAQLNRRPDVPASFEDLTKLKRGMQSVGAERNEPRKHSIISGSVAFLSAWKSKLCGERHRVQDERSVTALSRFEKTISTWDREQARIALAVLGAITLGERGPMESMFGKGVDFRTLIGHLKMGNIRVLMSAIEEITGERLEENNDKEY